MLLAIGASAVRWHGRRGRVWGTSMTTETCDQSLFSLFDRAVEHRERTSPDRLCLAEIAAGQNLDARIMATWALTCWPISLSPIRGGRDHGR